mmetsp:Transcript_15493/g.46391  ORF Transcript_15493/g.46391 Transcript_15493/m.46391 type:complete len:446 (-) Transcript_15493:53-1390(-)
MKPSLLCQPRGVDARRGVGRTPPLVLNVCLLLCVFLSAWQPAQANVGVWTDRFVKTRCLPGSCTCECKNGPYFYDPEFSYEGLGSFLQRIRLGALLDYASELTWIPPNAPVDHIPLENRHMLTWMDILGFRHRTTEAAKDGTVQFIDCNECSMFRALNKGRLASHRYAVHLEKLATTHVSVLCARATAYRHFILRHSKSSQTHTHHNSTLVPMVPLQLSEEDRRRAVVMWDEPHHLPLNLQAPGCTVNWFEPLYSQQYERDMKLLRQGRPPLVTTRVALPEEYTAADLVVGVHFRDDGLPVASRRIIDPATLNNTLLAIRSHWQAAHSNDGSGFSPPKLYMFVVCVCKKDRFSELQEAIPDLVIVESQTDSVVRDLDLLAHTDVFIGSQSSYSVLAATLNRRARCLIILKAGIKYYSWGRPEQRVFLPKDQIDYDACLSLRQATE